VDPGPADLVVLAVTGLVDLGPAGLRLVDLGPAALRLVVLAVTGLVDLRPAGLRLVVLDLVARAGQAVTALVDPVDLDPAAPVDREARVGLGLVGRAAQVDLAATGPVGLDPAARVGPVDRAAPVDRVDLDLTDLVDRVVPVGRADRHRRRTRPMVPTTGVARRWAGPGMPRTASARPTTVHRRRPHNTDSAGMVGLHPEHRRLSGRDRRPRVAGTVHRLRGVGTRHGVGRRVT
jgi:hypothetical protein